jgi:hypothetical protein
MMRRIKATIALFVEGTIRHLEDDESLLLIIHRHLV